MNKVDSITLNKNKQKISRLRKKQEEDTISAWLKHQTV
jgi:hypothetical protein